MTAVTEEVFDDYDDETALERELRLATAKELGEQARKTVDLIIEKMLVVIDELSGHPLYEYQRPFARRFLESLIIADGATLTALWARQCLDGDTVVFRRDGSAVRIREHEDAWSAGVQPTKRYKMRGGADVIMTDNHPVRTPDGWRAAGLLKPGDKVAVAAGVNRWVGEGTLTRGIAKGRHKSWHTVVEELDENVCKILGYFVTDGSYRPNQSAKFTNVREAYLSEFSDLMEKRFEIVPKRYAKGKGADLLITTPQGQDNRFRDFLSALNWDHGFPTDVFNWTPETVSQFVNRAWSGDGCISMKTKGPEITLACGNDEVYARYWQALLLKFGVRSMIKQEWMTKSTKPFYRLVLPPGEHNTRRFFQSFGLIFGKEEQSLAAIDFFALKPKKTGKGYYPRKPYEFDSYGCDGETLVWERINSIEDAGEREVFSVTYEGKGWYIAQCLQTSNSGKSETISNTIAAVMIMFPVLAKVFPQYLGKFAEGVWVGAFAPVDEQADTLYGRIVSRLTSDRAIEFMQDPDIQDGVKARGRQLTLKSGSLVRKQTAHPKATIEGRTYHVILIDECQGADEKVVNKSIMPMGTATLATKVFTGTPTYHKGVFYDTIQQNKREGLKRGAKQNHFEADWRAAGKANPNYLGSIQQEIGRIGEDSDEFKLAYRLMWMLEAGMFTSAERLKELGDKSMQIQRDWDRTPVVVGIDPARKADSTVVTVVYVNWDKPDEYGFFEHRILNWLDLGGTVSWEAQYHRIVDFLKNYNVLRIGVDTAGVGDAVADRLRVLMPWAEIVDMPSDRASQSKRWKHLKQLLERGKLNWPAHAKTRELKTYKRFIQQMEDLQIEFTGPYMLAAAPEKSNAHDDYADSLAIACMLTTEEQQMPVVEVFNSPFYGR